MTRYSDFVDRILLQPKLMEKLCPGDPLSYPLVERIRKADPETITGDKAVQQEWAFNLVRGALYYAVDALDPAHSHFQDESRDLGSYWHGMMHRREGDFDNARYWFRRAGRLPIFDRLHAAAAEHSPVMARQTSWDPYLFTGECEQARFGAYEKTEELAALQRVEWEILFDYCWRAAVG